MSHQSEGSKHAGEQSQIHLQQQIKKMSYHAHRGVLGLIFDFWIEISHKLASRNYDVFDHS